MTRRLQRRRAWALCALLVVALGGVAGYVFRPTDAPLHYFVVWIKPGAPVSQDLVVLHELRATPGVVACYYWSQLDDFGEAGSNILTPSELPASIRCVTNEARVPDAVRRSWMHRDGVYEVTMSKPIHLVAP